MYKNADSSLYKIEFKTNIITVGQLVDHYCRPEKFLEFCKDCPEYGAVWSCPPLDFDPRKYLYGYHYAAIIGTKISYEPNFILESKTSPEAGKALYNELSLKLHNALLEAETFDSKAVAPGSCRLCQPCERVFGRKCKYPDKMRYSFDAFGMGLGGISMFLLGTELLWEKEGLPEYHMPISAFLINNPCGDIISENIIRRFKEAMLR